MHAVDGAPDVEVTVRDATLEDLDGLSALWHELMEYHVRDDPRFALAHDSEQAFAQYFEAALSREDYKIRLAELEGRPIGFVVACILPNSPVYRTRWIGYINDLSVTASMRRHGIGRRLVLDAVAWLRQNGAESVEVYVAKANAVAQRFWRQQMGGRDYLDRLTLELPGDE